MKLKPFIIHGTWSLLSVMITFMIILGAIYAYFEMKLPNVAVLKDAHMKVPMRIYTQDGKLIAQYGVERRTPVALAQIPKPLIEAVIATEDARYYEHPGVDMIGIVRAAKAVLSAGRKVQGASTITMQVARNFFLSDKKTYSRKIKEILLALKINNEFSKQKILELYLNKVYFGNRAYGVAAAAEVYYGKKLDQLTLPQMATIAGLPQAPSADNPIANPKNSLLRRNHVLYRMYKVGFINKATYEKAIKAPNTASYHGQRVQVRAPYIAEMVRQLMVSEYGKQAYELGLQVYTTISSKLQIGANHALQDGLIAYSERHGWYKPTVNLGQPTINKLLQWEKYLQNSPSVDTLQPAAVLNVGDQSVQVLLKDGDVITIPWSGLSWARPALSDGYVGRAPTSASQIVSPGDVIWVRQWQGQWQLTQIPKAQGAIVVLNPQNGGILAISGGFDYALSNFNRAIMAQRQPGSNFKPFIYSAALAKGYTLASTINDAPIVIRDYGENRFWRPHNDTDRFYGLTTLRVALEQSRNLVSIRLLQQIGIPYALNYIRRFGFDPSMLPHSLSLALGSCSVTPLQIVTGYAVFANGGFRITPYFIEKIVKENGKVIFQADPTVACSACITNPHPSVSEIPSHIAPEVLSPQNAYLMTQVLRGVIQNGTGRGARVLNRNDLAGKTGTTNRLVDAWFTGFNSHLLATVWMGFDNMQPLHEFGDQAALPIWIQFMHSALRNMPEGSMPQPPGIIMVRIDPHTGLLAAPDQSNAIFEVFRKRYAPTRFSQGVNPPVGTEGSGSSGSSSTSSGGDSQPLF